MQVETKYNYEKNWTVTQESDLLKIIAEEAGDADTAGTLLYIKEKLQKGKIMSVGSCKFRKKGVQ